MKKKTKDGWIGFGIFVFVWLCIIGLVSFVDYLEAKAVSAPICYSEQQTDYTMKIKGLRYPIVEKTFVDCADLK